MPPTTHLLLATVGGMILAFAIMLLVRWIKDKVNPPEDHIWQHVWIGDTVEGQFGAEHFKSKVLGIYGTSGKRPKYMLIVKVNKQDVMIPYDNKKIWRKVQ